MYEIHSTQAIILQTMNVGEANRFYWLLTRELGLVYATAQSVRKEKSKLNSFLQQYSIVNIEMVHGKDIWRITNARAFEGYSFNNLSKEGQYVVARICNLLKRLIAGQDPNEDLFDEVSRGFNFLYNSVSNQSSLETMLVLKILHHLGYWEENVLHYPIHVSPLSSESLQDVQENKKKLVKQINESLRQTQL